MQHILRLERPTCIETDLLLEKETAKVSKSTLYVHTIRLKRNGEISGAMVVSGKITSTELIVIKTIVKCIEERVNTAQGY